MVCKVDNKKVFDEEQPYTFKCEACEHFCKVFHYRSCEERHKWNREKGVDVFANLRELDNAARAQQGQQALPSTDPKNPSKKPLSRHRGRR